MGKKGRKTRWRTLTLNGQQSDDSEDSGRQVSNGYHHKSHYTSKFLYSSQSTPVKKFQNDAKSTRSSSTASEHKITFNEDEYTKITTPRQDVLFKKGYLNKPKNYQTQTSTGNSTTTTTSTPDHQSADGTEGTDLEYESQFVFPNGFIDQNGIYYINSFEPYPFVVYNTPLCYPEFPPNTRTKRYSTDSMTESTSPSNEEVVGQESINKDLDGIAAPTTFGQVFFHPGICYNNGVCSANDVYDGQYVSTNETRRFKKRRRRRLSKSQTVPDGTTSEYTDYESSDDVSSPGEETFSQKDGAPMKAEKIAETTDVKREGSEIEEENAPLASLTVEARDEEVRDEEVEVEEVSSVVEVDETDQVKESFKYDLKPDAEEFVPRAYRNCIPSPVNFVQANQKPTPSLIVTNCTTDLPVGDEKSRSTNAPEAQQTKEVQEKPRNEIDIAKIVSKLEQAAKEQQLFENKRTPSRFVQKNKFPKPQANGRVRSNDFRKAAAPECGKPYRSTEINQPLPIQNGRISKTYSNRLSDDCSSEKTTTNKHQTKWTSSKVNVQKMEPNQTTVPKASPNRWISVSSRKKRRNKTNESNDEEFPIEDEVVCGAPNGGEVFESYDVNLLQDVIPPKKTQEEADSVESSLAESEILATDVVNSETVSSSGTESEAQPKGTVEIVDAIPSIQPPNEIISSKLSMAEIVKGEKAPSSDLFSTQDFPEIENVKKSPNKKRVKKTAPPTSSRRILVTDVDLSVQEVAPEIKIEESKIDEVEAPKVVDSAEPIEKRTKKKKKKPPPKAAMNGSASSSNATLNNLDDSYDFLLETSILENSEEKTNVEMSQELDRMIQKGLYNNLEEKIKSLNINAIDDGFFKTIDFAPFKATAEKNKFTTATADFDALLLRKNNDACAGKSMEVDFEPRPSTSKEGLFLENPETQRLIKSVSDYGIASVSEEPAVKKVARNAKSKNKNKRTAAAKQSAKREEPKIETEATPKETMLYPITNAVREWMTKTRETTPDVEILKSPNAIYKEFSDETAAEEAKSDCGNPSVECADAGVADVPDADDDDEVVIFSKEDPAIGGDLLERREDTVEEEGQDALEVYESKYGTNADYLKLKAEIDQQFKCTGNAPKHGNLPYRAICCNLM